MKIASTNSAPETQVTESSDPQVRRVSPTEQADPSVTSPGFVQKNLEAIRHNLSEIRSGLTQGTLAHNNEAQSLLTNVDAALFATSELRF